LFIQFSIWQEQVQPAIVFPVVSSFTTVYIFYIGFIGVRYSGVFHDTIPEIRRPEPAAKPDEDIELQKHAKHIASVMESQKAYLNPDLTLPELAGISGLTTGKTSQVLNWVIGKSFYTFVNEYRAEHFTRNVNNPEYQHLSLIGLAYECGFKSKSTFNKFFKSYTGQTPSRYRKKMSEKSPPA
jgi:AraC-like DNA-binding protein